MKDKYNLNFSLQFFDIYAHDFDLIGLRKNSFPEAAGGPSNGFKC